MAEFVIDEKFDSVEIFSESIKISGLSARNACGILDDANSLRLPCYMELSKDCITINVKPKSILLENNKLIFIVSVSESSVHEIIINVS